MSAPAAIAELCGPVSPALAPDAGESAMYAAVGDDERARDPRIAATAYRKAIALDPNNAHARDALATLCQPEVAATRFAAIAARFAVGDLDAAEGALAPIAAAGGDDAAAAHFFLGLIALAHHEEEAAVELAIAARDPAYAGLAASLRRTALRQGLVEVLLLIAPELDTNPQLLPDTPPAGATTGPATADTDLLVGGIATVRPTRWLLVRDALTYRAQRTLRSLDYLGQQAQLEGTLALGADRVALRYDLDYDRIGGASYLVANRGAASYRHALDDVALVAEYGLRYRAYQQTAEGAFTGWVHAGALGAQLRVTPAIDLDVRGIITREQTADATFAELGGGVTAALRARLTDGIRLSATVTTWYARYDAAEPDGTLREDLHGGASADLEVDLADHLIGLAGVNVDANHSTVDDFRYWRVAARLGIALAVGGP